jgi:hypothetical protein
LVNISFAQSESSKIYNTTAFKKGFYKSYEEYINNAPSIVYDFTVKVKTCRESDSAAICVDYTLVDDNQKTGSIWGFCDGKNVYIRLSTGLNSNKYWRVEHIGICPVFYYYEKGLGFGPGIMRVVTLAAAALSDIDLELAIRDDKDKTHTVTERYVEKLLEEYPDLLSQFKKDMVEYRNEKAAKTASKSKKTIYREYLIKFNNLKKS